MITFIKRRGLSKRIQTLLNNLHFLNNLHKKIETIH